MTVFYWLIAAAVLLVLEIMTMGLMVRRRSTGWCGCGGCRDAASGTDWRISCSITGFTVFDKTAGTEVF